MITNNDAKSLFKEWLEALYTDQDLSSSELARLIFGLSTPKQKLEEDLAEDPYGYLTSRKGSCLTLLLSSLTNNGMRLLADLEGIPADMITMIPKATSLG